MRNSKIAIITTSILSIISLIVSIYLETKGNKFASGIFVGIFSSSFLTIMLSIINYITERRKVLETFYSNAHRAIGNFNKFDNDGDLERSIDILLMMNQFDYTPLDTAYGDMCFFFKNKSTHNYIYQKIYKPIFDLSNTINEKCWHFEQYRKAINGNKQVMRHFIDELDSIIMTHNIKKVTREDGSQFKPMYTRNKVVEDLEKELNGRYYNIMYLKKRR